MASHDQATSGSKSKPENTQYRGRSRGEEIREYILAHVDRHPGDISTVTAENFTITRQAINKHLQKLVSEKALRAEGQTRHRTYRLAKATELVFRYHVTATLEEDRVWREDIEPVMGPLPQNVRHIWAYCFTEMFNNAIDHSGGTQILVKVAKTASNTQILLHDDGVGIFRKIQTELRLIDERHAILELAKGKLTTDPARHSGQGIFFTSRMLDSFDILSGGVYLTHSFGSAEDWILELPTESTGSTVFMKLRNFSSRTTKSIFDEYSSGDDYGFTKTVVPVRLAQYGQDELISRSQAKRVLSRVEQFKTVIFDFDGVPSIGQAFADEMFRVFAGAHPQITLSWVHATAEVRGMIRAAQGSVSDS